MFLLGDRDVRRALNLQECLAINRKALMSLTDRTAVVPSRLGLPYPNNPNLKKSEESSTKNVAAQDWTLIKPAAYYGSSESSSSPSDEEVVTIGLKVVSIRAQNPSNGLPLVPATILLIDAVSGVVQATINGTYVTVARTSAGPALAVQTFQPNVQHLVLFGAGAQAECHVQFMEIALKRKIPRITIINRSSSRAEALQVKLLKDRETTVEVIELHDTDAVNSALKTADVVSATTNTTTPLFQDGSVLKNGCLVTSIGSYTPNMQEIPESAVNRSHVIIDTPEAMEVGDLKHLGSYSSTSHPVTLAGDALADPSIINCNNSNHQLVFFKTVGTAIQDVLTAQNVVDSAKSLGIGKEVDMD